MVIIDVAAGYVTGFSGAGTFHGQGADVLRVGQGRWDITLSGAGVPAAQCLFEAGSIDDVGAFGIVHTSDTVKQVTMREPSGFASSTPFSFRIRAMAT